VSAQDVTAGDAGREALAPGTVMALVAMGLGVLVIANDFTALNVAIPSIEEDFDTNVDTAQWVINAYALVFGMAIVTGGRLADMFGRRKVFFIGTGLFAAFSALGAAAPNVDWLIGCRVGMAIGGALMWPAILGMTFAALPASRASLAGALILGIAGLGNAVGPLIGGALSELSWRWIFVLNVPVAAFAVAVTYLKVHQPREEGEEERIDYVGSAALSLGLLLLLVALDQSIDWGWSDWRIIAMLALSVALIVAFGFIEPRMGASALIPSDVARNREFISCCLVTLMLSAVFFSIVLYVPQYLQKILDYSPLTAGAGMLPMLGLFALSSFVASPLYRRIGAKAIIGIGALLMATGPFLLSRISEDSSYTALIPGLAVTGIGVGLFLASITTVRRYRARSLPLEPRGGPNLHVPDRRRRDRDRCDDDDLHLGVGERVRGQGRGDGLAGHRAAEARDPGGSRRHRLRQGGAEPVRQQRGRARARDRPRLVRGRDPDRVQGRRRGRSRGLRRRGPVRRRAAVRPQQGR
jgi:EmrB/QacA subfamily drug resistance transporter